LRKAINHLKKADPVIAEIIERVGPFRLQKRPATFWALARAIVFQQLNGKAATTIWNRLEEAAGGEVTPASILALSEQQMRACGLSKQKLSYVRDLATRTLAREIDFDNIHEWTDDEVIEHLTRVKGIGEWTAHMFLMFALRRPNILPVGDFGVRSAMRKAYGMKVMPKPVTMRRIAKQWHPFCSAASWYMWRSLDVPVEL
jgi:DNA-3-methyladenine glycosylase II